jgi:hypothetical protein
MGVKYMVDLETGCWKWWSTASLYPKVQVEGKLVSAHRHFFQAHVDSTLPEGHHVHHVCLNKHCVNPDHLEAMDPVEHGRESAYECARRYRADYREARSIGK